MVSGSQTEGGPKIEMGGGIEQRHDPLDVAEGWQPEGGGWGVTLAEGWHARRREDEPGGQAFGHFCVPSP